MSTSHRAGGDAVQPSFFSAARLRIIGLVAIAALILAAVLWWAFDDSGTRITATFERTVGVYQGSDVRILGVNVGHVDSVTPKGDAVEVTMKVNKGIDLPANVSAVEVIPSVVADRFVQLTPAYSGGAKASSTVVLGRNRTEVPVEVDELYSSVEKLSTSLGPEGVNKDGALSEYFTTNAENLDGNGEKLGKAIENLSHAATTLNDSRGNYVDTVKNIDVFVNALRENDKQVRVFNSQMDQFNSFFAQEKSELSVALDKLSVALGDVAGFIGDNREKLGDSVRKLEPTTKALVDNDESLLEALTLIPLGFANFTNSYNAEAGAVQARLNIRETQDPLGFLCKYAFYINQAIQQPGNPIYDQYQRTIAPIITKCQDVTKQINDKVLTPLLPILPFGVLSGEKLQKRPAPNPYAPVMPPTSADQSNKTAPARPSAAPSTAVPGR